MGQDHRKVLGGKGTDEEVVWVGLQVKGQDLKLEGRKGVVKMKKIKRTPRWVGLVIIAVTLVGIGFFVNYADECKAVTIKASGYVVDWDDIGPNGSVTVLTID